MGKTREKVREYANSYFSLDMLRCGKPPRKSANTEERRLIIMPRPPTVDIDEFTLVLSLIDKDIGEDWIPICESWLKEFLERSQIEVFFGKMEHRYTGLPKGYISGLSYDNKPWYLVIAWHEDHPCMGVCVRFSAYAWSSYQMYYFRKYNRPVTVAEFLAMVRSNLYNIHLTRIDLVADYFDYPDPDNIPGRYLKPDTIYRKINTGEYSVKTYKGMPSIYRTSAIDTDGEYQTVYLGSKQGTFFLRIYDKREEQLKTKGFRYDRAINCKSWVRFEMVVRHDGAKTITEQLLTIQTIQELQALIAKHITDKYRFIDVQSNTNTEFTDDLLSIASGATVAPIKTTSNRNMELARTIAHIRKSSGLYSLLYKVYCIWGAKEVHKLMIEFEVDFFREAHKENRFEDIDKWINKHFSEYKDAFPLDFFYADTKALNTTLEQTP